MIKFSLCTLKFRKTYHPQFSDTVPRAELLETTATKLYIVHIVIIVWSLGK